MVTNLNKQLKYSTVVFGNINGLLSMNSVYNVKRARFFEKRNDDKLETKTLTYFALTQRTSRQVRPRGSVKKKYECSLPKVKKKISTLEKPFS